MTHAFLWGAATAGHQVEGNNDNADIWLLEQVPETQFSEPSADACDSLHRWQQDIALIAEMGLNAYRFSVEWSRIEPTKGAFSIAWLDRYTRIAEACRERDIAPVVTLSHFTSPRWFAAAGGWEAPDAPQLFSRFAERVARAMGHAIPYLVTFNEPNLPVMGRWKPTPLADPVRQGLDAMLAGAARACGSERYHVWVYSRGEPETLARILEGHRGAREAWRSVRPTTRIGMSLAMPDVQVVGSDIGVAAYRAHAEMPFFEAARDDDFIAIQNYGRMRIDADRMLPPPIGAELTETGDEFYPQGLGPAIRHAHAATGKPVLVTENGIAAADDRQRQRFLPAALASLKEAQASGVPVLGYFHWSLLDNFEWRRGYSKHFGLVTVNRTNFRRTPKPSARIYEQLIRKNRT